MLGPIPMGMKTKSKRKKFLFDVKRDYHIKNLEPFQPVPIRQRLVEQFLFSEAEATEINDFLSGCLIYQPAERCSAADLLKHKWLN